MKTIGLIGGMSWESSSEYYKIINEATKKKLGGLHSAKIVLISVDFAEIEKLQHADRWNEAGEILADCAKKLEVAGVDVILICTNTMHKLVNFVTAATSLPLLHIVDTAAERIKEDKISHVGLLGTKFTMEQDFYKGRLSAHGISAIVPSEEDRIIIHEIIYNELCLGFIKEDSRRAYLSIIDKLIQNGAEGIILGCTEIALLIKPEDCHIPLYSTDRIHAEAAVKFSTSEKEICF